MVVVERTTDPSLKDELLRGGLEGRLYDHPAEAQDPADKPLASAVSTESTDMHASLGAVLPFYIRVSIIGMVWYI